MSIFELDCCNRPDVKELNVVLQKDINIYLSHALPLCAILSDSRFHPWYYEHFIQIYALTDARGYYFTDFLDNWAPYRTMCEQVYMGKDLGTKISNIIEFVIENINLGYYVIIHLDEYYIPGKYSYNRNHFVHQSIIYSYDNKEKKFYGIGFNSRREFTKLTFDYETFKIAYQNVGLYYKEFAPWVETNIIEMLKLRDFKTEYPFDLGTFLIKLDEYINSKANYSLVYALKMDNELINKDSVKYGLEVHDELIKHLKNLLEGKVTLNYIAFHLLLENKRAIYIRLQYILSKYNAPEKLAELVEQYLKKIVQQVESIRTAYLKQSLKEHKNVFSPISDKATINSLINSIALVKDEEKTLLLEIYSGIKKI